MLLKLASCHPPCPPPPYNGVYIAQCGLLTTANLKMAKQKKRNDGIQNETGRIYLRGGGMGRRKELEYECQL